MVQLDLSAFKPTTLLSKWWPALAVLLKQLQDAHNTLEDDLGEETAARVSDKNELLGLLADEAAAREEAAEELGTRIDTETAARLGGDSALSSRITSSVSNLETKINTKAAELDAELSGKIDAEAALRLSSDNALSAQITDSVSGLETSLTARIDGEAASRLSADNDLSAQITDGISRLDTKLDTKASELTAKCDAESAARTEADNRLSDRIDSIGNLAHRHNNLELIEGISVQDVEGWRAAAEEKYENAERLDYFDEMCRDFSDKLNAVYAAMGVTVYDGGIDGQLSDKAGIDGGEFDEEETGTVDFGGFDDTSVSVLAGAVFDGGTY